ncbi:MAG TPA: hypothetical protein VEB66_00020 [Opitutaceae bacterium]|nr:hypothetical protein [Opitutaceae bacterium]
MNLDAARTAIIATLGRMNALYTKTVFDEWVLASIRPGSGVILAYQGPRAESYKQSFARDIQPLNAELGGHKLAVGDFAFVQAATGTQHDAVMRLGDAAYLFCNNIGLSMEELRKSPLWLKAQAPWVQLSDLVRKDPLQ